MNAGITSRAIALARMSWDRYQNNMRPPEPNDWQEVYELVGRPLSNDEKTDFVAAWSTAMGFFSEAHASFLAFAHATGDPNLLTKPRFAESIMLNVLGEIRKRLGPLGQSTRLFQEGDVFSVEPRTPPKKTVGDNHEAFKIACEVRDRVLEAVEGAIRPEALALEVGPISRVEEPGEEPFTAVLVTASSPITKPVVLAVYAERI